MGAIERIRERLAGHPELSVVEGPGWIEARPPGDSAFAVGLAEREGAYTVHFGGWHEEFETEDSALDLFALGLSDIARLRVTSRGAKDYRWTLETREEGIWTVESTTGLILFPFWRRRTVRYLQNSVIPAAEP